jgi:PAS domain S-box-containing protein
MKKDKPESTKSSDLRKRAERELKKKTSKLKKLEGNDTTKIIHELEVHQIELEMQNEELRRAQTELEESRSRYSDLYDFAPMGYFVFDKNGMITDVNLTGTTMLGIERSKLIKSPFSTFIKKGDKDRFYLHRRKAISTQGVCSCELTITRKDSTEFFAQFNSQVITRENSLFCRTAIIDITKRKQAEEKFRKANEQISNILESITDAFISVDHNWRYTYVNHGAAKLLGKTREQMLGNVLWDVFPEAKHSQFDKEFHRAVAQNIHVHFEAFYPTHNTWYECHCYPSDDGLSVFFTNINERKEVQKKIENLAKFPSENPNPVLRIAKDGVLLSANKASASFLTEWDCPVGEIVPENWQQTISEALTTGSSKRIEIEHADMTFAFMVVPILDAGYVNLYAINVTERKKMELRQRLAGKILGCLNQKSRGPELIKDIIKLIKEHTGFTAVGIRLREGDDFPFFEIDGFSHDFVKAENYLCARDESGKTIYDSTGHPVLECMCGNVLSGRTDSKLSIFTKGESFWTNSTTELLKSDLPKEYQGRTRNRCNQEGYESVGLIPLRTDEEIVGLLQISDTMPGRFTLDLLQFFEGIGASIGIALARVQAEQEIQKLNRELEQRVAERTAELEGANKTLQQQIEYRRHLEKEILTINEKAQRLIGRELHDDIGQLFAGTALMLKALQQKLAAVLPEQISYVEKIAKLVDQAIDHTKRISKGLAPMNLNADNLVLSLRELAAGTKDLGIHCTVRGDTDISLTDTATALNLYRIAQESLNNAIKHGKAKNIQIKLTCDSDRSKLTVESDGLDFPEVLPESKGMGLKIMHYRSELINGSLDVHRGTDGGTIVTCVFPSQR